MDLLRQFTESMGDVLALGVVSAVGLAVFIYVAAKRGRRGRFARIPVSERGSYSVSLLMALPTFVTLLAMFVQCTCLMLAKLGTIYAAYAAARSAMVWIPSDAPSSVIEAQVHLAAAKALAPFASSNPNHQESAVADLPVDAVNAFADAYEAMAAEPIATREVLAQKLRNSFGTVEAPWVFVASASGDRLIQLNLKYHAPLAVPGLGLLLGKEVAGTEGNFFAREIETTVTMTCEWPTVIPDATPRPYVMGIRYDQVH